MTTPNDLPRVGTEESYKDWYIEAMCASNSAGFVGLSAAQTIDELDAMRRSAEAERDELASRVRELEGERDQVMRNRDMWKGQCERQAETLGMYHAKSAGLERDGLRYRYMRDLRIEQTGMPGQPCIAMPNGMQSGYYLTEETADHAIDTSITAQQKTSPESKP